LPKVNVLLHNLATVPVTSQKVFSSKLKVMLQMSEDRLEMTLVLIEIHRDKTLVIEAVIDSFAIKTMPS
jgi:hypothetical protein